MPRPGTQNRRVLSPHRDGAVSEPRQLAAEREPGSPLLECLCEVPGHCLCQSGPGFAQSHPRPPARELPGVCVVRGAVRGEGTQWN